MDDFGHISVLLNECIEGLNIRPDGVYVDGTLGMGGHSYEIAKRLTTGKLYCIDRDMYAIGRAGERLRDFSDRTEFIHGNFADAAALLKERGVDRVDGMLFDLGVSSPQLDDASRGFSYMNDAPLDMRMDRDSELTAFEVVNYWPEEKLQRVLWDFGEERYARRIVGNIISHRSVKPVETTGELCNIIREALPAAALREKQHPAKRTFQAIRIAVNDELDSISEMLSTAPDMLASGGRICVISFHSLEDRIVKNAFAKRENGCTCPREAPVCICGFKQSLKIVNRKPILPSPEEKAANPRARSAKLRIAEHI